MMFAFSFFIFDFCSCESGIGNPLLNTPQPSLSSSAPSSGLVVMEAPALETSKVEMTPATLKALRMMMFVKNSQSACKI
jgi:hypothetical protein